MNHHPRTNLSFLLALTAYGYLFYQQGAGINFLLFNLVLTGALAWIQPHLFRSVLWRWLAMGSTFSSGCVAWYGNDLALTASLISWLAMVGYSCQPDASFLLAWVQALHSILTAPFRRLYRYFDEQSQAGGQPARPTFVNRLYTYALPVVVTLFFFLLYRSANANFASTLSHISFDFISMEWILWMMGGFLLLFGVFYREVLAELAFLDFALKDNLSGGETDYSKANLVLKKENSKATALLWMLNGLLLLVNLNDFVYFSLHSTIPDGSTYAEYVHQGVYTLILTMLMAIGILLYYFRGDQHFFAGNRLLLSLSFAWIVQNGVLLSITACKNQWYVEEYGLTYKRIGVYIYLLLTLIGLITTLYKLKHVKSGWFLIRKNSWALYTVLVLSAALNWDQMIVRYNLHQARVLDVSYLLTLSDTAIPELFAIRENPLYQISPAQKMRIENRREDFLRKAAQKDWQSLTFETHNLSTLLQHRP
jgi:hypothetical protein